MTAQERKVYSKKKLLLAKQKNKAKIRRSVRKDLKGRATEQDCCKVYWGMKAWTRKAEEKRSARKKALKEEEEEEEEEEDTGNSEGRQGLRQTGRHT
jgi:CO dehydrogenase/acetyl-CoA synthase beta subunit